MSTTLIQQNLWKKLQSKKYRHSFVASQIGASVAAQIASTRVARGWTQKELAKYAKMSQVRISVLEDPGYENFTIKTLRRLAEAFDTALIIRFAPFSEMLGWLTTISPEHLAVKNFDEDLPAIATPEIPKVKTSVPIELYQAHGSNMLPRQSVNEALRGTYNITTESDLPYSHKKESGAMSQMLPGTPSAHRLANALQLAQVGS